MKLQLVQISMSSKVSSPFLSAGTDYLSLPLCSVPFLTLLGYLFHLLLLFRTSYWASRKNEPLLFHRYSLQLSPCKAVKCITSVIFFFSEEATTPSVTFLQPPSDRLIFQSGSEGVELPTGVSLMKGEAGKPLLASRHSLEASLVADCCL